MSNYLQKIIKLRQDQYDILASGGTVGDYTGLNANYLYLIQDEGGGGGAGAAFIVLDADDGYDNGYDQMQWDLTEEQYNLALDSTQEVGITIWSDDDFFSLKRTACIGGAVDFISILTDNEADISGQNGTLYEGQVIEDDGDYYFRTPLKAISVLTTGAQSLTSDQKAQVQTNLGLSDVAFSGDYNDLTNTPSIPVVSLTTTTGSEAITVDSSSLNLVTRNTAQTITATKTFKGGSPITFETDNGLKNYYVEWNNDALLFRKTGMSSGQYTLKLDGYTAYIYNLQPAASNAYDIGTSSYTFNDLYLGGGIYLGGARLQHYSYGVTSNTHFTPTDNAVYDLGATSHFWKDLYLNGNLTDGTNSITVANIQSKVEVKRFI